MKSFHFSSYGCVGWISQLWTADHSEGAAAELYSACETSFHYTVLKQHFTYLTVHTEVLSESYFATQHGVWNQRRLPGKSASCQLNDCLLVYKCSIHKYLPVLLCIRRLRDKLYQSYNLKWFAGQEKNYYHLKTKQNKSYTEPSLIQSFAVCFCNYF